VWQKGIGLTPEDLSRSPRCPVPGDDSAWSVIDAERCSTSFSQIGKSSFRRPEHFLILHLFGISFILRPLGRIAEPPRPLLNPQPRRTVHPRLWQGGASITPIPSATLASAKRRLATFRSLPAPPNASACVHIFRSRVATIGRAREQPHRFYEGELPSLDSAGIARAMQPLLHRTSGHTLRPPRGDDANALCPAL